MSETAAPTTAAPPASSTPPAAATTAGQEAPQSVNAATAGEQGKTETPPPSKTTVAGIKENKETTKDTAAKPSVIEQVKRYIPGLGSKDEPAKSSKRKKSGKKTGTTTAGDVAHAKDPALATATLETAPSREELPKELQAAGNGNGSASRPRIAGLNGTPVEEEPDTKKFSAAAYVQKRLRTNNKKIQKLQSYQDQTTPLNEDQKKSLQQKPILEAIQRELGEISKAFETEEADEAKRAEKQKKSEEHRVQQKVAAAVSDAKLNNQNELALLLQFLHLYSLFNPGQATQYNQSAVPPVVANATALQHRAVHELFQNLANGPLVGSGDDAVSHIENLRTGSSKSVIEGVTFAEVKQMILDLTAGPAEMGHELPASEVPTSSEHTAVPPTITGTEHESSTAGAAAPAASGLNFMQASEIESGSAVQSLSLGVPVHPVESNEIGSNAATPGFGNTPSIEKTEAAATHNNWDGPAPSNVLSPETLPKIVPSGWEEPTDPVKSWADDVEENNQANPFTATPDLPADTQELQATNGPIVDADGFTQGPRGRGRGRGEGRGGGRGRGEGRGRGSGRGGRGGASGEWTRREPREPRAEGESGERRGSFRGRGRGEGRPRGDIRGARGGERRPQSGNVPTVATTQEA